MLPNTLGSRPGSNTSPAIRTVTCVCGPVPVYTVAVSPALRRRGVGTALVRRVEEELAARGCPKVNLQVRASNEAVVAFYRKLGYAVEERVSMGKRLY